MRLSIMDNGHRLRAKAFLVLTEKQSHVDSPDIVRMLLYRPGFLGRALLDVTVPAMRGPSAWTPAEREYLAMATARLHECPFCVVTHAEMTRIAGPGPDPDDPGSVRPELRAVREFLDVVSRSPGDITDVPDLPAQDLRDALRVNLVWNVVNRLANAFGFELRDGQLHSGTRALHRFGYRFPGFLLAEGPRAGLREAVLERPARTAPALRQAAASGEEVPEPWRQYAATVRDASHRVTDDDVARLKARFSEDEIFEVTVAAAVGAALRSQDAGLAAVERRA